MRSTLSSTLWAVEFGLMEIVVGAKGSVKVKVLAVNGEAVTLQPLMPNGDDPSHDVPEFDVPSDVFAGDPPRDDPPA